MGEKVTIAGAGLAGSLLAILLAKKGFQVDVIERRPDMRRTNISAGRSINLALSNRGLRSLRMVEMDDFILKEVVPMKGRMVHMKDGSKDLQSYSGREGNHINSVSRGGLNKALMDKAETYPNVNFRFDTRISDINYINKTINLHDENTGMSDSVPFDVLIGADGANSAVRLSYQLGAVNRFSYSQQFLGHGYKELEIPASKTGEFQIEDDALHIWPRHDFMMIALPNFDGSFTVTLFQKFDGENGFDAINNEEKLERFFKDEFSDALEFMPNLAKDYFSNPTGNLATVKCYPWSNGEYSTLIGDAAHAIVPFYGQGMNASFEDCRVLDEIIDENIADGTNPDWHQIFDKFQKVQKENGDAIGELAIDNYKEMRSHTASELHVMKHELELKMEEKFSDFDSKYSLVTFRDDVSYHNAKKRGEHQDAILLEICSNYSSVEEINIDEAYSKLKELLA